MFELKHYLLRDIEESDLELVLQWRNSEQIRTKMFSDHIISFEEHQVWYKKLKQSHDNICRIFLYRGCPIGVVNISQIDKKNNKCYWGFFLGEQGVPYGSGTVMGYLALEYIFEILGVRKLCAEVFSFNFTSLNFHKKLGFCEEGLLIKHVLNNGEFKDVICLALFSNDWNENKRMLGRILFGGEKNSE
jgi:UDP-4-amino-4,6-dideoxy-N-acetyl-beta-L-altrosamine N-acetyltransferase